MRQALKFIAKENGKSKIHGINGRRRVWRKQYITFDSSAYEIIATELSLSTVKDREVIPKLLKQTRQSTREIYDYGAYDTRACHTAITFKGAIALTPPRQEAAFWEQGPPQYLARVVRSYTAQISIGKSGIDTTNFHSQTPRCIRLNFC